MHFEKQARAVGLTKSFSRVRLRNTKIQDFEPNLYMLWLVFILMAYYAYLCICDISFYVNSPPDFGT